MNKNLLYSLIISVITAIGTKAQKHEIGVHIGMSNLVGDIGMTNYLLQKPMSTSQTPDSGFPFFGGITYRMHFNPYQTIRLDLGYNRIQFDDRIAKEQYRRDRKLWGTNNIFEANAVFEYYFYPVNNEQTGMLSPYIFAGVGGMVADASQVEYINDFRRDADGLALEPTSYDDFVSKQIYSTTKKVTMSIPFGVGLKYKFNYNWSIYGEVMFRPTFSDALDYSNFDAKDFKVKYDNDILDPDTGNSLLLSQPYLAIADLRLSEYLKQRQVGEPNSKDWINSITIGLSYSFGRPPCYCE